MIHTSTGEAGRAPTWYDRPLMSVISPADTYPAPAVPYATPAPRPGAKVWAGAAILFGGICLILLGGCFLVGVMVLTDPGTIQPHPLTTPQTLLMIMLYVLAFASFAGAVGMLVAGTRGLLKVIRAT